jgi:hypothetical protein
MRKSQQKGGSFYKEIKAYLKYQKLGEADRGNGSVSD